VSEVAPGTLDAVRRFLNTVSFEKGEDALNGPDALLGWIAEEGYEFGTTSGELARLRAFREALREVAFANAGHDDRFQSWQALQPFVAQCTFKVDVAGGEPVLKGWGAGDALAIASILCVVYDAVRSGEWLRFKACRADDCRWAFYDESKNGSGTWCSMAVCGNRHKARRRRQRSASTAKVASVSVKNSS
jgi:predicted RNA-binding Zn ribbon-like protein